MLSVSVIIPTYNERDNIALVLRTLYDALTGRKHEIIVIDDSSPDGTADAVRSLSKEIPSIRLLTKEKREGIGAAIRHGFDSAHCDVLLSMDADLSFDTRDIPRLLRRIEDGSDLVIGSRHMPGGGYEARSAAVKLKRLISRAGNLLVRLVTGYGVSDYSGHFRAIRRSVWEKIQTVENTNSLALEMILKTAYAGFRVDEIPVKSKDRTMGVSKRNLFIEAPKFLFKLFYYTATLRFG